MFNFNPKASTLKYSVVSNRYNFFSASVLDFCVYFTDKS